MTCFFWRRNCFCKFFLCFGLFVVLDSLLSDSSSLGVGELEITPVSAAIARYLGIDLTAEEGGP